MRSREFGLSFLIVLVASCSPAADTVQIGPDIVFVGSNIVTMDGASVGAVSVSGEIIDAVGTREELLARRGENTRVVELGERALLPGFIDAHGHLFAVAMYLELTNLSSPPVGSVETIDDLVRVLQQKIAAENIAPGDWVFGYGYDDSLLAENRHPTRDDLDRVSTQHPVVLSHVSGHLRAGNSAALAASNISADTPDPPGGVIRRRPGTDEPNGVTEETANGLYPSPVAGLSEARQRALLREALYLHASYGITTVQDGGAGLASLALMQSEAERAPFPIDVVAFAHANRMDDEALFGMDVKSQYKNGFRIGGVKFVLDGSPQGRTAWLSEPYTEGPPGEDADYVAYPTYPADEYTRRMVRLVSEGTPVLAHANGDAAIDMMIDGVDAALDAGGTEDHRSVIIHAQLMRSDQLDRARALHIVPSFYAVHPFFWGDWHRLSFGEERAAFISPIRATIERDIPFTIHNDAPVVPPDMMRLVWVATNRKTRSGFVLGPGQRATTSEALSAITRVAAYQYFEEQEKGTISVGKQADLVILDRNPLQADPDELKDILVLETLSHGKTVFRRD